MKGRIRVGWPERGIAVLCLLACASVHAQSFDNFNDYGGVGLMQMPSARFAPAGEFAVGIQTAQPYNQLQFTAQPSRGFEAVLRYSEVTNVLYGPVDYSGHQSYKDRSVDLKLLLLDEGRYLPALALGVRDLGGTGLFSGEYLVASRRYYDFDFTLGMGWGRLGYRAQVRNPFTLISDGFNERPEISAPGSSGFDRLFHGPDIGFFGGVRWQTPWPSLSLVAELDGNDYQHEVFDNDQKVSSPINLGLAWRPTPAIDTSLSFERGNTVAARISIRTNFNDWLGPTKFLDPPLPRPAPPPSKPAEPPMQAVAAGSTSVTSTQAELPAQDAETASTKPFEQKLKAALSVQGINLQAIRFENDDRHLTVWFTQGRYRRGGEALGRIARVLVNIAPDAVDTFTLSEIYLGFEGYRVTVLRGEALKLARGEISPEELARTTDIDPPQLESDWASYRSDKTPGFSWSSGPALRQHVGGPDQFYFYQIWWRLGATISLLPNWNISSQFGLNIYNNFDDLKQTSNSTLPHVRSDIAEYLKQGEDNIVRLETNYFFPLGQSLYGRVSAGIFEEMYGGVAGEVLYRHFQDPWALSLRVDHVWQRDYDQLFTFRDYDITTGHLTAYYEMRPADIFMQLSYGRYLAGDWGATLNMAKVFRSGASVGFFVTKTNVSAEDFGEGSFDKGVYVILPFDLFFGKSTRRDAALVFRPLTRDGGQMVRDGTLLYGATTTVPAFTGEDNNLPIR